VEVSADGTDALHGDIVVLSPHLDDAIFSVGAVIATLAGRGERVRILTVLAGNPDSSFVAGPWDRDCGGFTSHAESAHIRRGEDERACAAVGATPVWLPFNDEQYDRGASDEDIFAAVRDAAGAPDAVLSPGHPLTHADHRWLAALIASNETLAPVACAYVEQPYAHQRDGWPETSASRGSSRWYRVPASRQAQLAKLRGILAYSSQLRCIRRRVMARVVLSEWRHGGEMLGDMEARAGAGPIATAANPAV
jgi:LmbE family N-acetylglucosaminyl deacetylase